jgi:hypothetical protein
MKDFLFFGNPTDRLTLVDLLKLTLAAKSLQARLRACENTHIAWLATHLTSRDALGLNTNSNPAP